MYLNQSIFRAYDIRGVFEKTLFGQSANLIGQGLIAYLHKHFPKQKYKIFVGYDGRISSPILRDQLLKGLAADGVELIDVGLCPTPLVSYLAYKYAEKSKVVCGIMITGSHNPKEYNGFKITVDKESLFGEKIQELKELCPKTIKNGDFLVQKQSFQKEYIARLMQDFEGNNLNIVWDPANGATADVLQELITQIYKKSSGKHIVINEKIDGNFPSHHPDPTVPENLMQLRDTVLKNKFDLGIGFDGDGDRIGIVTKNGKILKGYEIMVLFSRDVIHSYKGEDVPKIISDIKTSNILFKDIELQGGKPIMWKTGHSYIKNKLKLEKGLLAGEMSGHIFFADKYFGFDDAIYSAIRLINIANKTNIEAELKILPKIYSSPEIKYTVADDKKFALIDIIKQQVMERVEQFGFSKKGLEVFDLDGIRLSDGKSFILVRASNTTPSIIVAYESFDESIYNKIAKEIEGIIEKELRIANKNHS